MPQGLEFIVELQQLIKKGDIKVLFDHDGTLIHSKDLEARRIYCFLQSLLPENLLPSEAKLAAIGYGYKNVFVPELVQALIEDNPQRQPFLINTKEVGSYFFERVSHYIHRHYANNEKLLLTALEQHKQSLTDWLQQGVPDRFSNLTSVTGFFLDFESPNELGEIKEMHWLLSLKEAWCNSLHKQIHAKVMDEVTVRLSSEMKALPGAEVFLHHLFTHKIDVGVLSGNFPDVVFTAMNSAFSTIACPYPRNEHNLQGTPSPHCDEHVNPRTLSAKRHQIKAFNNHFGIRYPHKPDPNGLLIQLFSLHQSESEIQTNPQLLAKSFVEKRLAKQLHLDYKTLYVGDDLNDLQAAQNAHFDYFIAVETGSYKEADFTAHYRKNNLTIKLIIVETLEKLNQLLLTPTVPKENVMLFKLPDPIPFQFHVSVKKDRTSVQLASVWGERLNAVCFVSAGVMHAGKSVEPHHLVLRNKIALDAGRDEGEYASPGGRVDLADAGFKQLEAEIVAIVAAHENDVAKAQTAIEAHVVNKKAILLAQWVNYQTRNQKLTTPMRNAVVQYQAFTGGEQAIQQDFRDDKPINVWVFMVMADAAKREAKEEASIDLSVAVMVPINRKAVKAQFDKKYTPALITLLKLDAEKETQDAVKGKKLAHIADIEKNGVDPSELSHDFRSIYFIASTPIVANQLDDLQRCTAVGERNNYSAAKFVPISFDVEKNVQIKFDEKVGIYRPAIITGDGTPCRAGGEFYAIPVAYDALQQQQAFLNNAIPSENMPTAKQLAPISRSSPLMASSSTSFTAPHNDSNKLSPNDQPPLLQQ